jgi:hypothetical protein
MNIEADTVQLDDDELLWIEATIEGDDLLEEDELDATSHVVK